MRQLAPIVCGIVLCWAMTVPQAKANTLEDIIALHWWAPTAAAARGHSLTTAMLLNRDPEAVTAADWKDQWLEARTAFATHDQLPSLGSHLSDGQFGRWAGARVESSSRDWRLARRDVQNQWFVWQAVVARAVPEVWSWADEQALADHFGSLLARWNEAPSADRAHALAQARRVMRMAQARSDATRNTIEGSLLLSEARFAWEQGQYLASAWLVLEGLDQMVQTGQLGNARFYSAWLNALDPSQVRSLRSVDLNLPVIVALLIDAASHLADANVDAQVASEKLSAAFHYLAFFLPNASEYLDQPVRDRMRSLALDCASVAGIDAEKGKVCVESITELLNQRLNTDELIGATGPLSPEFLARELDLVSWQRARYLDSYVNWLLSGRCDVPQWVNVLEWHLGVQWLGGWADQYPVDVASLHETYERFAQQSSGWLQCWSTHATGADDLMTLLMDEQFRQLEALAVLLANADQAFYASTTRPNADVDLDQLLPSTTQYRNTNLQVVPCDLAKVCGARVGLPVNTALLDLVPDGYWMADQLQLGEVRLCYDEVKWIDRAMRPARENDPGVANYSGRLSFDFKAFFQGADQSNELIVAKRVESELRQDYFFGPADPASLNMDCPHGLEGQPIESGLNDSAPGLVPTRLTYFTSVQTPVASHLIGHWAQGQQWRDQLVVGERTQTLEQTDDTSIRQRAEVHRLSLLERRERALATRLSAATDQALQDSISRAMLGIDTLSRLIRSVLELHYGSILRLDDGIRATVAGEQSLLGREDIRRTRDQGLKMSELASIGQARLEELRSAWTQWPLDVRVKGVLAPELQTAAIDLQAMTAGVELLGDESPKAP